MFYMLDTFHGRRSGSRSRYIPILAGANGVDSLGFGRNKIKGLVKSKLMYGMGIYTG